MRHWVALEPARYAETGRELRKIGSQKFQESKEQTEIQKEGIMTYQHNLETDKLEISTGSKAAWNALPTEARDTIKRYCNFSRTSSAWISKGHAGSVWWRDKLATWGFADEGQVGEKLSIEERIEAKQERAAERADRYEDRYTDGSTDPGRPLFRIAR